MKINRFQLLLIFILSLFLISNCGQNTGIEVTGVTGGGDDGYGSGTDNPESTGEINNTNSSIIGSWSQEMIVGGYVYTLTLTFRPDGTYKTHIIGQGMDETDNGTYSINGNQLFMDNEQPSTFSVNGNILTIDVGDEILIFQRV